MNVVIEKRGEEAKEYMEFLSKNKGGIINFFYTPEEQILRMAFNSEIDCFNWAMALGAWNQIQKTNSQHKTVQDNG